MQNEIVIALKNSLIGDNVTLQQSNQKLSQMSKHQGYCMTLMEIINEQTLDLSIKQAALVQLKNNVKSKWKPKNEKFQMSANQKLQIRNAIILAVIQCAKKYMLIKLYREVLTTIIGYQFENWIPTQDLTNILNSGGHNKFAPGLQCIIAISTNFQFSVIEKQKVFYSQFLKQMLPVVFKTVKENIKDPEIIYLSLKILWKAVHYEVNNQVRQLTNQWMELIYLTIEAVNEDMQKKLEQYQQKNTPQFYYYHSKKWATRILMRFIQKHAKAFSYGKINNQNLQYSNSWYSTYGIKLCSLIVNHLSTPIPTTKKIRYFQLKIVQGIIADKPELISEHVSQFQYNILLKYMTVTPEDEKMAQDDVVEYLRVDDQSSMTHSNIKRVATQVWNSLMQLGSKLDRDHNIYKPGPYFQESIKFMYDKIKSTNLIQKQLGMYLFCENRITINRVPIIKQKMPQILHQCAVPQLTNQALLIRARALDMMFEYGRDLKDMNILTEAIKGIYICLNQKQWPLISIKAAIALNPLISHTDCKKLLQPEIKNILQVYLKLIQKYDLEQVVSALQFFIGDYADSIGPFAVQLFRYLCEIFIKMFNKDIQLSQNDDYGSEVELAAAGCIKTMSQIIQSPLQNSVRVQIQQYILDLCAFIFKNDSDEYHEDMMYLMRVHLQKIDKITPQCWFFYQVIIYYISGIPPELWNQIQNLPLSQNHKQILASVREGNNIQFLQFAIPVIRNYFGKGYSMIISQKQEFKTNFINMLFHLVGQVYRKSNSSQLQGQLHFDFCSMLLVYLIQTFPPQMTKPIIGSVWNICKFNLLKGKSIYLKNITCQIICLLLWRHPIQFLQLLSKQKHLPAALKQIQMFAPRLQQNQQRKRVILGICTFLMIVQKDQQTLGKFVPKLFKILLKSIKKNCFNRIILNTKQQNLKKQIINMSDNDSEDQAPHQEQEDDEDLWDEQYNERHISMLRNVNQLLYFQQTIQKINTGNQTVYQLMVSSVANQKLLQVQALLQKSINLVEK